MLHIELAHVFWKAKEEVSRRRAACKLPEADAGAREALRHAEAVMRHLQRKVVPDFLDRIGGLGYTTDDGLEISVERSIRINLGKDRQRAVQWLEENGHAEVAARLASEGTSALQEFVARQLDARAEVPLHLLGASVARIAKISS